MIGFPWWPALIKEEVSTQNWNVVFFGDYSEARLDITKLKEWSTGLALKFAENRKKKL